MWPMLKSKLIDNCSESVATCLPRYLPNSFNEKERWMRIDGVILADKLQTLPEYRSPINMKLTVSSSFVTIKVIWCLILG